MKEALGEIEGWQEFCRQAIATALAEVESEEKAG
jgi:hypothetical protein